jgi:hypothetical protein
MNPAVAAKIFAWLVFNLQAPIDAPRTRWLHRDRGAP